MNIAAYGFAIWETFYVTVLSTAFALVLGLPLGVLLVAGDKDGILPLPGWLMHLINIVINILRSVPFLILMICVFPLTRAIVGTTVGTKATIVPLVVAAFPFVARLVETSLRELDEGCLLYTSSLHGGQLSGSGRRNSLGGSGRACHRGSSRACGTTAGGQSQSSNGNSNGSHEAAARDLFHIQTLLNLCNICLLYTSRCV